MTASFRDVQATFLDAYLDAGDSPLVYLASPYSHDDPAVCERRFQAVSWEAARLLERGVFAYAPIAHTHPLAIHGKLDHLSHALYARLDMVFLRRCDSVRVLALDGWKDSRGVLAEMGVAWKMAIPVTIVPPSEGNPYVEEPA